MPRHPSYRRSTKKRYTKKVPKKVRTYVNKAIHRDVENKILAIGSQVVNPVTSAIYQANLNGLLQGTNVTSRVGNKVTWMGIDIRMLAFPNATVSTPARLRVILVWNRQTNGALLPAPSLLQDSSAQVNIISPFNYVTRSRYKVIYDKVFVLHYGGDQTDSRDARMINIKKKFKAKPSTEYIGTGNSISDIAKNSLELFIMSDVATNPPYVNYTGRCLFEDA